MRTWGSIMVSEEGLQELTAGLGWEYDRIIAVLMLTMKPGTGTLGKDLPV